MTARSRDSSPWINVAIIGPHQHGKSTLTGFLLYALQQVPSTFMDEADQAARSRGDPSRKFAFLLDRKAHERTITPDGYKGTQGISWFGWENKGRHYILIDSPGRHDRIISLIGALSDADAVLLVVDTDTYLEEVIQKEAGQGKQQKVISNTIAQIHNHLSLARFYGVRQVIVALHKMDKINFSEKSYLEARAHLEAVIEQLGWNKSLVHFVPTAVTAAAEQGYNIIKPDSSFSGSAPHITLLKAIEQLRPQSLSTNAHFRMQLSSVHQGRQMPIPGFQLIARGKIAAGTVQVDDELLIQPSEIRCKVSRIYHFDKFKYIGYAKKHWPQQTKAISGESVNLHCTIIEGEAKVRRGEIAGTITSSLRVSQNLRAEVELLATPPSSDLLAKHFSGTFAMGHFSTGFRVDGFSLDGGSTWQPWGQKGRRQKRTSFLDALTNPVKENSILVELRLARPVPLEIYTEDSKFGRFVLFDSNSSLICGGYTIEIL